MISEPLWFLVKIKIPAELSGKLEMPEYKGELEDA